MEIRNLNTFLHAASLQNITRAAAELGYSQSAVSDLGSALRTGRCAGGDGSLTGQDGLGAAAAAGVAAAAAVGAGQTCLDLRQTGVDLHLEHLGGDGEDQTENDGEYAQNGDRIYNSHSCYLLTRPSGR